MSDYTEFLRQKIKMASFKGFEVTPELTGARMGVRVELAVRRYGPNRKDTHEHRTGD
jgi:hypothetical protein